MRTSRWLIPTLVVILALIASAWLLVSVGEMHDRIARHSRPLAVGFLGAAGLVAAGAALTYARFLWRSSNADRPPKKAPEDIVVAAEVQAEKAEGVIRQIQNDSVKAILDRELSELRADRHNRRFHVVVFGTGSAGKTSLINALLGQNIGKTDAIMGTTKQGEVYNYTLQGVDGTVELTDTPGLSEIGSGGAEREALARDLAARADLLLFVLDHDLIRAEYDPLVALARQGKRSIVLLNKQDRLVDEDREAILAKLRERLEGVVPRQDVIAIAASPRPTPVRMRNQDGTVETILEVNPPDLSALVDRIGAVLKREGDSLRAGNLLLRAHLLSKKAQDQVGQERDARARQVVEKFQWITAATIFANPIPALDLMAAGAVQFQMITELASVYGVDISTAHVKMVGSQMAQMLLKLGLVEATTSLVAGLFKSSFVGYAAGGAIQAVSMAYLTHISGSAFLEYFAHGQSWGDGGMQQALIRQFDLNSRAEFLQEFAKQALDRVVSRVSPGSSSSAKSRS
ncbi:YcjF family protein [Singulisphaera sp. PoT]|uniref:YcjF family protein n=1 Tax=Singulisphaera sp. PoT TaxID=3411797 RepID=UPI003BF5B2ED